MANRTFLKDKKIVIYKQVTKEDEAGFQTRGYMPIHEQPSLWAYFKQLSADLIYKSNTTRDSEECLFRINWNKYVRNSYASDLSIGYNGLIYDVTRIDPYEDYTRDLVLYAKNKGDKITNVIDYDPTLL